MKLTVVQISRDEVYRDMARVPEADRKEPGGEPIKEGGICCVKVANKAILLSLRGAGNNSTRTIQLDDRTRNALGLNEGDTLDFEFRQVGWLGQFLWAWRASDPAYRIAARFGLISLSLSAFGVVLGVVGICIARHSN
jgi:hypothetical protein